MATTEEMVATLDADIAPFKQGMNEAAAVADTNSKKIAKSLDGINKAIDTIKDGLRVLGISLSAFGLAAGTLSIFRSTLDRLSGIAETSDAIGTTTQAYQELSFAAARAGIAQQDFNEASTKAAQKFYEAGKGLGSLHDTLTQYNPNALAAINETDDFAGKMRLLGEAVKSASSEQQRGAIISAAFGESNAQLRRMLIGGAEGFDAAAAKARELGVIIDDELVRRAPEVREKFAAVADVLAVELQNAFVTAAPTIVVFSEAVAQMIPWVNQSIDGLGILANLIATRFSGSDLGANSVGVLNTKLRETSEEIARLTAQLNAGNSRSMWDLFGLAVAGPGSKGEQDIMQQLADLGQVRAGIEAELGRRGWQGQLVNQAPVFNTGLEDRTAKEKAGGEKRALSELNRIEDEYLKATKNVTDLAMVEHDRRLTLLQANLDAQLISAGDYVKARAELEATLTAKLAAEAQKQIQPISNAISGTLSQGFDEFIKKGTLDFEELTRSMLANVAKVAFQMAVLQPLFGGGTTQGGGIFGSLIAGIAHDGAVVGSGGPTRMVPGLAFAMAPRLHSGNMPGFKPGERPYILEDGEGVLSRRQMAGLRGGGSGGGNNTTVQVINNSGAPVQEERSRSGNTDIVRIMIGKTKEAMGRGEFDGVMSRFGSSAKTLRR